MDDEDGEIDPSVFDRLILQVFEEQEERSGALTYPLSTQRHALDFVKLINRKGFPYVLMCQAIDEKQEKFRSWRLGNGNTYIGSIMMKRINKTVQEAMMLPDADADVDIDDLIDDDDDDDEDEVEITDENDTTDEDEQRPATSSASSPAPATEQLLDDHAAAAAAAAAAAVADRGDSDDRTTSPTAADGGGSEDTTSGLIESQASVAELQTNEQQQPSIGTADVTLTTDTTGTDLPEPSLHAAANQPETENTDKCRQEDLGESLEDIKDDTKSLEENQQEMSDDKVQMHSSDSPDASQQLCHSEPSLHTSHNDPLTENTGTSLQEDTAEGIVNRSESLEDKGDTESLAENQPEETSDDKVQMYSSDDIPDANQQVCHSVSSESADSIPSTSPASMPSSEQPASHAEVVSASEQELPTATSQDQETEKCSDTRNTAEIGQRGPVVTDDNVQNDVQASSLSELDAKSDHEPDLRACSQTEKEATSTIEREQTADVETAAELATNSAADDVTSWTNGDVDHEDVKVTEESKVAVVEEVKVTYEASAKQLDLLSRLAMLREKAAQRKASDTVSSDTMSSDTVSIQQDGPQTSSGRFSQRNDDITRPSNLPDDPQQQQKDKDDSHILTSRPKDEDINKDKETSSETDKQPDKQAVGADTEQHDREGTASSSCGDVAAQDAQQWHVDVSATADRSRSTSWSSVRKQDATVERETTDTSCASTAEHASSSTNQRRDASTDLDLQSTATHADSVSDTSVIEADNLNTHSETAGCLPDSASTDTAEQAKSSTASSSTVELQLVKSGLHQPGLTQATSAAAVDADLSEISDSTTAAADFSAHSQWVHGDTKNTSSSSTDQTDGEKVTEVEFGAAVQQEPADSSSCVGPLEPTQAYTPDAAASSVTDWPTEPTHPSLDDDQALNYDSDLDREFADSGVVQLLSDVQRLKSSTADGPGFLCVFTEPSTRRFMVAASRSPAKRLRQATVFNPDMTILIHVPVSRRRAALRQLRQHLAAAVTNQSCRVIPESRDWFAGGDDVIRELVAQAAAATVDTTTDVTALSGQ